jgi:predicted flap endonuclease-1-like 5' DNA nuclease
MDKDANPLKLRTLTVFFLSVFLFLTAFQQQTGGIPPWVWVLVIIVLVLLVAWWGYRSTRQSTPPPTRMETPARMEVEPVPPERTPDDLTIIEGIGPKIAAILQSAGITTFDQLAAADVSRIREILDKEGLRLADPGSWAEQARLAAAGDQAGLKALQDRLTAGRQA